MKILFVIEKPSIKRILEKRLKELNPDYQYDFAYNAPVYHINDGIMAFHLGDNGEIMNRDKIEDAEWLTLKKVDIPKETFFELNNVDFYKTDIDISQYDMIVLAPDHDANGILGSQKFMEDCNIQNAKYFKLYDLTEVNMDKLIRLEDLQDFDNVFQEMYNDLQKNGFIAQYTRKNDIGILRKQTGWTRKKFAEYFDIPYRTVENWENYINECSWYLYELMEYKLKNEGIL